MKLTEELLSGMVFAIKGSHKIEYHANGPDEPPITIDFTPPWKRLSFTSDLEKILGIQLPQDLTTEATRQFLVSLVGL